jgi:hypothetical protein
LSSKEKLIKSTSFSIVKWKTIYSQQTIKGEIIIQR